VSRANKRTRARLTVTVRFGSSPQPVVCRTRDVSDNGLFLETGTFHRPATSVALELMDEAQGEVLSLQGVVARSMEQTLGGSPSGLGVRLVDAPIAWHALVTRLSREQKDQVPASNPRRLRVLVVADEQARRGALALYVTSGWDVRFASDLTGAVEAMRGWRFDAVISEHDLDDERWARVLDAARMAQPSARRIVRSALVGRNAPSPGQPDDLVHRVVDLEAGLDAVLDALSADWGNQQA
jgi:CheY-like chemotaxis protein